MTEPHDDTALIHGKLNVLLVAVHHLLKERPMAKIHDDIRNALAANDGALIDVGAKTDALLASKSDGDAAFGDILGKVTSQGSAIAALGKKIADATPVEAVAGEAPGASEVVATAGVAPVVGIVPSV